MGHFQLGLCSACRSQVRDNPREGAVPVSALIKTAVCQVLLLPFEEKVTRQRSRKKVFWILSASDRTFGKGRMWCPLVDNLCLHIPHDFVLHYYYYFLWLHRRKLKFQSWDIYCTLTKKGWRLEFWSFILQVSSVTAFMSHYTHKEWNFPPSVDPIFMCAVHLTGRSPRVFNIQTWQNVRHCSIESDQIPQMWNSLLRKIPAE